MYVQFFEIQIIKPEIQLLSHAILNILIFDRVIAK